MSVPLLLIVCLIINSRALSRIGRGGIALALLAGALDMAANISYLEASRGGLLSLVAVVSSLYPASTVMLGFVLDRERVNRWQSLGIGLAAAALVLVTLGRG